MAEQFLHGVDVIELDDGPRPIQTVKSSIIGLVGTAAKGPVNIPTLLTGSRQEAVTLFGKPQTGFTIPESINAVYEQTGAMVVVINVADPANTNHQSKCDNVAYTFDKSDTLALAHASVSNATITNPSDKSAYKAKTDYTVDTTNGIITRTPGGSIKANSKVTVSYRYLDGAKVTPGDIIGGVDAKTGNYTGLSCLLGAQSVLGVTPRLLVAPYFTHQTTNGAANPVVAELIGIAERLRAMIIADCPDSTIDDAIAYRQHWGSARLYCAYPWATVYDANTDSIMTSPLSARIAGLIAKSDNDRGFWFSPSNIPINGIVGLSKPIDFTLGDSNCVANYLNEHDVTTVICQDGYRLWGNRTTSADMKWAYLSVRRTADIINDSLLNAHLWAVDRNITKTYIQDVTDSVNHYLRHLKSIGAIIDGTCWADPALNTSDQIAQGKITLDFDFTPPYPAEHITFRSCLTQNYLTDVIS